MRGYIRQVNQLELQTGFIHFQQFHVDRHYWEHRRMDCWSSFFTFGPPIHLNFQAACVQAHPHWQQQTMRLQTLDSASVWHLPQDQQQSGKKAARHAEQAPHFHFMPYLTMISAPSLPVVSYSNCERCQNFKRKSCVCVCVYICISSVTFSSSISMFLFSFIRHGLSYWTRFTRHKVNDCWETSFLPIYPTFS